MYIFVYVFLEGCQHHFSPNFVSILTSFWEASGSKSQKKEFPERCENTAPKTELRAGAKVALGSSSRRRAGGGRPTLPLIPLYLTGGAGAAGRAGVAAAGNAARGLHLRRPRAQSPQENMWSSWY